MMGMWDPGEGERGRGGSEEENIAPIGVWLGEGVRGVADEERTGKKKKIIEGDAGFYSRFVY